MSIGMQYLGAHNDLKLKTLFKDHNVLRHKILGV